VSADTLRDTRLAYAPGRPVRVHVHAHGGRTVVSDDGAALAIAGAARGWRAVAAALAREFDVNISRHGVVSLPVVPAGPGLEEVSERVAEASLALCQDLLDLES
jgi:hypothetical protein